MNENGLLRGGFSLRYQRARLPEEKRAWFDEYVGVKRYASLGLATPEPVRVADALPGDLKDPRE
jgi:hypothetical protein